MNTKYIRKNIFYIHLPIGKNIFFPLFHDEKLYILHIFFSMRGNCNNPASLWPDFWPTYFSLQRNLFFLYTYHTVQIFRNKQIKNWICQFDRNWVTFITFSEIEVSLLKADKKIANAGSISADSESYWC